MADPRDPFDELWNEHESSSIDDYNVNEEFQTDQFDDIDSL